jgi:hypothetical protein
LVAASVQANQFRVGGISQMTKKFPALRVLVVETSGSFGGRSPKRWQLLAMR